MSEYSFKFGIDIAVASGALLRPTKIQLWNSQARFESCPAQPPFKYMSDAMIGLSVIKLNTFLRSPLLLKEVNTSFCDQAWRSLDPHFELYQRSQQRVNAVRKNFKDEHKIELQNFEKSFSETLSSAMQPWGVDLNVLHEVIDQIEILETKCQAPLLYNFKINFSKQTTEQLHVLYSMLYHLRSMIAVDHNAQCEDTSVDGVKVDSITDYIPRADYVSNDAVIYYQFKKMAEPFVNHRDKDSRIEKLFVQPLEKTFKQLSHNAVCLIESLPTGFLSKFNTTELEEVLHLVQMDWLLGSEAGLLFKVREELYALQSGYEKVFWHDLEGCKPKYDQKLSFGVDLKESEAFGTKVA